MFVKGMFRGREHIPLCNKQLRNIVRVIFVKVVRKIYKSLQLFFIANCNNFSQRIYALGQTAIRVLTN